MSKLYDYHKIFDQDVSESEFLDYFSGASIKEINSVIILAARMQWLIRRRVELLTDEIRRRAEILEGLGFEIKDERSNTKSDV